MPDKNLRRLSFLATNAAKCQQQREASGERPWQAGRKSTAEPDDNSDLQRALPEAYPDDLG